MYITTQVITFHQAGPPVALLHLFSHSAVLFYPTMVFLVSKPLGFLERHCNLELDPKTLFLISIWQKFSETEAVEGLEGAFGKSADSESSPSCLLVVTSCLSFPFFICQMGTITVTCLTSQPLHEDEAVNCEVPCLTQRECSVCKCNDRVPIV